MKIGPVLWFTVVLMANSGGCRGSYSPAPLFSRLKARKAFDRPRQKGKTLDLQTYFYHQNNTIQVIFQLYSANLTGTRSS